MKSYYIHFIRHGAIEETLAGRYIGTTNPSLSDEGKRRLRVLDHEMDYPYAAVVFSSPLKRCIESAKLIYPHLQPIVLDQLCECDFGLWENKTADELKDDPDFEKWLAGDPSVKPPRGESNADFTKRVCLMFENLVDGLLRSGTTEVAVIAHGGVMMTLLSVYGLPQAKPFDWVCDNGYGYSVRINAMLWQRDKVVEVFQKIPKEKRAD